MNFRIVIGWIAALCLAACATDEVPGTLSALSDLSLLASDTLLQVDARVVSESPVSEVSIEYALRSDFPSYASCRVAVDEDARISGVVSPLIPDTVYFVRFRLLNSRGSMLLDSCRQVRTRQLHYGLYGDHEEVDMGCGVLWATCNVGAAHPWEAGLRFAWGEVEPKTQFSIDNYRFYSAQSLSFTKYTPADALSRLLDVDDAAACQWRHGWRMPTAADVQGLMQVCWAEPASPNGVPGLRLVSTVNGAVLFFPFAGGLDDDGSTGHYWLSVVCSDTDFEANSLLVHPTGLHLMDFTRDCGFFIRPVHDK